MHDDITPPWCNQVCPENAILHLGVKAGTKKGRPETFVLTPQRNWLGLMCLLALLNSSRRGQRLTSCTCYQSYARWCKRAWRALGITGLTPHSPRAGWASYWRLAGMPFTELRELGRWSSDKSLRIYLDIISVSNSNNRSAGLQPLARWLQQDFLHRFAWWPGATPFLSVSSR